jgi:hypothetical protein
MSISITINRVELAHDPIKLIGDARLFTRFVRMIRFPLQEIPDLLGHDGRVAVIDQFVGFRVVTESVLRF